MPRRPCLPSRLLSSGCRPPLFSVVLCQPPLVGRSRSALAAVLGDPSLPLPLRLCSSSRLLSSGFCPPLPSAFLHLAPAPALLSLVLPLTQPQPRRGSVPGCARLRLSHLLGCPSPRRQGLPPPRPKPRGWGVLPGSPRPQLPRPSLLPPPLSPFPSRPMAPLCPRHRAPAPGLAGWEVGSRPLPPAHVLHPPL